MSFVKVDTDKAALFMGVNEIAFSRNMYRTNVERFGSGERLGTVCALPHGVYH